MGCASGCAKAIVIIINIFFFLLGLAFLAAGIIFFVGKSLIDGLLDDLVSGIVSAGNGTSDASGALDTGSILDIFQPIFIALIVIGVFMLVASILAMCGSCCSVSCMLITYVVLVLLVFCLHLAVFIAFIVGGFGTMIRTSLEDSIKDKFVGVEDTSPYSIGWNLIMSEFQCCGVNSYEDFNSSVSWDRHPDKNRMNETAITPVACCKSNGTIVDDYDCAYNPTDENNNRYTGCWGKLNTDLADPNKNIVIGVTVGILVFEILLALLSLCIIFNSRNKDD